MKKFINILKITNIFIGFFSLTLLARIASANNDLSFYVGAGLDYNNYGLGETVKSLNSHKTNGFGVAVPLLGIKFHENFGFEVGHSFNKKFKFQENININNVIGLNNSFDAKVKNSYVDFIGFMPIGSKFELLGGIGLARLTVKPGNLNVSPSIAGTTGTVTIMAKNKSSWRVKIGAQYNFNDNFIMRALAMYQHVGNNIMINRDMANVAAGAANITNTSGTFISDIKSIGLSVVYKF